MIPITGFSITANLIEAFKAPMLSSLLVYFSAGRSHFVFFPYFIVFSLQRTSLWRLKSFWTKCRQTTHPSQTEIIKHCLAVLKWNIHHFGSWQQSLAGTLFWLNSKLIKYYSLILYTGCNFDSSVCQFKFLSLSQRLFIISLCSQISALWRKAMKN